MPSWQLTSYNSTTKHRAGQLGLCDKNLSHKPNQEPGCWDYRHVLPCVFSSVNQENPGLCPHQERPLSTELAPSLQTATLNGPGCNLIPVFTFHPTYLGHLHTRVSRLRFAVFPSTVTLRTESSFTLTQSSPNMSL